ncbi:SOSS complex subunit B1-B-like [Amphibalanus amphitrite]|uniref:SOSS complex subunit B1-B-like n=1 Tax=Amphibalanus amphitrite TaxID=1232801 RepID=UPI001C8FD28E|nr:SOSS complex subunit B1-B-like [Amphibalanus amphitrite]XP_043194873.1 SOSS complex subunit B1-B-like [Amphibalanus amphitrite]XP_043194874.1 SOSS complex subunit B1-B-like [Amphibalanus amphitrite]
MEVREMKPGIKNITINLIILDIGRPNKTMEGHDVRTCRVADRSGSINMSVWDEPGGLLQAGDIIRVTKGYTNIWKNCLTLYVGKGGDLQRIGDFCMVFSELPFMSEPQTEAQQQQQQPAQPSAASQQAAPPAPSAPAGSGPPPALVGNHNGARDPRSAAGGHRGGGGGGWQAGRDPRNQPFGRSQPGRGRSGGDPRTKR